MKNTSQNEVFFFFIKGSTNDMRDGTTAGWLSWGERKSADFHRVRRVYRLCSWSSIDFRSQFAIMVSWVKFHKFLTTQMPGNTPARGFCLSKASRVVFYRRVCNTREVRGLSSAAALTRAFVVELAPAVERSWKQKTSWVHQRMFFVFTFCYSRKTVRYVVIKMCVKKYFYNIEIKFSFQIFWKVRKNFFDNFFSNKKIKKLSTVF